MLLLSHCTCTPGFVRSLDTVPVTPHPPMLAMFRDSPSCLGTELSPPRGNIPRGKRHKSHFSVSPPRKLPDYVGTSVWACSTPRTHMQRSCNYISIYLPCNQCQSNQHCRTPPIFAGFLFTTLRNGTQMSQSLTCPSSWLLTQRGSPSVPPAGSLQPSC